MKSNPVFEPIIIHAHTGEVLEGLRMRKEKKYIKERIDREARKASEPDFTTLFQTIAEKKL